MKPSTSRLLLAALGLLVASPLARADALADGRAALVGGDFVAAKTQLDTYLANGANPQLDDARILRAFARLGVAIQNDLPAALRTRLGANVADLDLGTGDLALRFPRPFGYFNVPAFSSVGAHYQYNPAINLYETGGGQPSISFENRGATAYSLTLTVSQPGVATPDFDSTFYLDGMLLGFANAVGEEYPFRVFPMPLFDTGPDIPAPFDLDLSTPDHYLSTGANANSFTVVIPPKSNFTFGLVVSRPGNLRLTPSAPLPSSVVVLNGKAGGITQPRLASGANFSNFFALAGQLETTSLAPAIADLEAVSAEVNLLLPPEETGSVIGIVIAYPDVQLLLAELKFLQGVRRLSASYNFSIPLTLKNLEAEPLQLLLKNPAFLTPNAPNKTQTADRTFARDRFAEAAAHYANASDGGLWSRPAPESGAYLFGASGVHEASSLQEPLDTAIAQLAAALTGTIPLGGFDTDGPPMGAGFTLSPLFGSPAINPRKLVPVMTDEGVVRGGSLAFLTSGFLPGFGTAAWENLLAESDDLDLTTPAIQTPAKIQRQPAALTSIPEGDPVTLSVVAESYPAPTYQWFRRVGKTEEAVDGANTPFFFLEAAHREDAGNYFVRVSNTRTRPPLAPITTIATSTTAVLQVTYAPEITTEPADVAIYQGKTVTLDVSAVGVPKPSFQWFKGDVAVTPVRATSKYVFAASAAKAGDYKVVVKNSVGQTTSETATVDVQTKPVFTEQPLAQTVIVGGSATFNAAATGNPAPLIKWRKDGRDIPGATGPSYTIDSASIASRGTYTAVAYSTVNTGPTTTTVVSTVSKGAALKVNPSIVVDGIGVSSASTPAD